MSVETSLVCSQEKLCSLLFLHISPIHWTRNFPYSSPVLLTCGLTALFFSIFIKAQSTSGWYNRCQKGSCILFFSYYLLTPLSSSTRGIVSLDRLLVLFYKAYTILSCRFCWLLWEIWCTPISKRKKPIPKRKQKLRNTVQQRRATGHGENLNTSYNVKSIPFSSSIKK